MAELTYNGVTLSYLSTHTVGFEPVMDDVAGVDYMYTRVVISGTAVITPNVAPWLTGESAVDTVRRISHLLQTPRRGLIYTVGGNNLVNVAAPNGNTTIALRDAQNGPNAQAAVRRIIGTENIVIAFRIETYVVDCPEAGSPPLYVSHRWTETAEVNELAMSRRARSGRLVVRPDLIGNADQLRGLVVPPLEPDFLRLSSRYTLQADGRVIAYEFVDEEQYLMPPNPAARAEGRFSITCKDGASFFAECFLRLQGAKPTDKPTLMLRAMSIALAKIQSANPPTDANGCFPIIGTLSENMFANDVTVHLSARVTPARGQVTSLSTQGGGGDQNTAPPPVRADGSAPGLKTTKNFDWLKIPANFNDGSGGRFDPGTRGSAQLLLIAAQLQDPCLRFTVQTATQQSQNLQSDRGSTVPAQISIVTLIPDGKSLQGEKDVDGVYEHYEIESMTTKDSHTLAIPVGKKDAPASIIQTAAPVSRRRVTWRAIKLGGPPRVPSPILKDTNWKLVNDQIAPEQIEPVADGVALRYIVSGCYDYVAKKADVRIVAPVPPWVDGQVGYPAQKPFVYADDILEPSQTTLTSGQLF